ncbi:MAG: hypothetical protein U0X92_17365 [Anaerolineales bacterium]
MKRAVPYDSGILRLEGAFPKFFAENGQYPLIVIKNRDWRPETVSKFTDQQYLKTDQYKDSSNLDARVAIHQGFSTTIRLDELGL